jgi:hypothetical protein
MLSEIKPVFVRSMPLCLEEGILFISREYKIAIHLCACGCGERTVTPLNKNEWKLENEGGLVSLTPSIGNFQMRCKSHYWIKKNKIVWA